MIKLQAAKCPQCNANIEVNTNLEKAICQYCGCTIIIEDVVPKIKVEHSGTIKIEGVKDRDYHLEQAKKHMDVNEYEEALTHLREIVKDDNFDIEAYSYIAISDLNIIVGKEYDDKYLRYLTKKINKFSDKDVDTLLEFYNTIDRTDLIDKNKTSIIYLEPYFSEIERIRAIRLDNKIDNYFKKFPTNIPILTIIMILLYVLALLKFSFVLEIITMVLTINFFAFSFYLENNIGWKKLLIFIIAYILLYSVIYGNVIYNLATDIINFPGLDSILIYIIDLLPSLYYPTIGFIIALEIFKQNYFIRDFNAANPVLRVLAIVVFPYSLVYLYRITNRSVNIFFTVSCLIFIGFIIGTVMSLISKKIEKKKEES